MMTVTSFDATMKDMYPRPGERIKQWVVDMRREFQWERETCPRILIGNHLDNTGAECRNAGSSVPWTYLNHDCCSVCDDLHDAMCSRDDVSAWLAQKAGRPPIEQDHTKLSDEVEPNRVLGPSPVMLALFARETAAVHAAMDRKEREIDEYGYGGKPAGGEIVGLAVSTRGSKVTHAVLVWNAGQWDRKCVLYEGDLNHCEATETATYELEFVR